MMSQQRTKVCYESLLDKFKEASKTWLEETPEARGLMLVVDWAVGRTDFPPGTLVTKSSPTEIELLAAMDQTVKMLTLFSGTIREQLTATNSVIRQAEALLQKEKANTT